VFVLVNRLQQREADVRYGNLYTATVPQMEPLYERQVQNNAGGYVFQIDDWGRLDRFLVLGSSEPTYYQSARALTRDNAKCVERCYDLDADRTVARIVEISDAGRAPKNDPAIFALALGAVHKDVAVRQKALAQMHRVCRTGTHLFQFITAVRALGRGWGRSLKRAVAEWYDKKPVEKVAYQAIKYRSRENYTHKRMLQTAHPAGDGDIARETLYRWICDKEYDIETLPPLVRCHLAAMLPDVSKPTLIELIKTARLPWEAIPTEVTKDPDVWSAMLPNMGVTALIRNLGGMTQYGTLKPLEPEVRIVTDRLTDIGELRRARIHPFNVLVALAVYRSGSAVRGSRSWDPVGQVVDALEEAFYLSFSTVAPTGKRTLIGLDVSGSMSSPLMGSPLSVCEGAAAMAMVTMRAEQNWHVYAFADGFRDLHLSAKNSLDDVLKKTRNVNFGGTDCSLPMVYALERGLKVDVFQVYTDNETYAGRSHPVQALQRYRDKTGIPAKLVVSGMTSTGFTIADPNDAGMLDVVGFDSAAPSVIADFARQ
jgi:60 kDa SS-A/Ro ribonucleoprotein